MDLTPFKNDIDELLNDFSKEGFVGLADLKRLWLARKFSYIFEGKQKGNSAVFMQGLYAHCIGHIIAAESLSQKLGGLYCLYCLYETQPYKPLFKIYLSLGELKKLKDIVIEAKNNAIAVAQLLVKKMLANNMFLFGFVDIFGASVAQRVDEITKLQDRRVQIAYERLLADTRIDDYLHMNIDADVELKELERMSSEYAKAKRQAIAEASNAIDVEDIKHIAEEKDPVAERMQKLVETWDQHKKRFYEQTGIAQNVVSIDATGADESDDNFCHDLESLLTEE